MPLLSDSLKTEKLLQDTCKQHMPRQRLQRVVVMAMSELAQDFEGFKNLIRERGGVKALLQLLTPSHDPFVIKETLALLGRRAPPPLRAVAPPPVRGCVSRFQIRVRSGSGRSPQI